MTEVTNRADSLSLTASTVPLIIGRSGGSKDANDRPNGQKERDQLVENLHRRIDHLSMLLKSDAKRSNAQGLRDSRSLTKTPLQPIFSFATKTQRRFENTVEK